MPPPTCHPPHVTPHMSQPSFGSRIVYMYICIYISADIFYSGLAIAEGALAESPSDGLCHKWVGILLGELGSFLPTKEKVCVCVRELSHSDVFSMFCIFPTSSLHITPDASYTYVNNICIQYTDISCVWESFHIPSPFR